MFETLFSKFAALLACAMFLGAIGAYVGRFIRSAGVLIALFIFSFVGVFIVWYLSGVSDTAGVIALMAWTFIISAATGPALQAYSEELGWETVCLATAGTGGVMVVCGAIGGLSGINFGVLRWFLFAALLGLVAWGIISMFIRVGRTGNLVHSVIGMVVFAGYFLFDFWRLANSENSWKAAIRLTLSVYLDFLNFLLYLLKFLANRKSKASLEHMPGNDVYAWVENSGHQLLALLHDGGANAVTYVQPALSIAGLC